MQIIKGGRLWVLGATLLAIVALAAPARATPYYVSTNGDDGADGLTWATAWATLGKAESVATNSGDSVTVSNGAYTVSSQVDVRSGVTFKSTNGYEVTTVGAAAGTFRMFLVYSNGVLDGFTITNGDGGNLGGCVGIDKYATLQNCHLRDNYSRHAAVYTFGNQAAVRNCLIVNNSGDFAGGIYINTATALVENCTIYGNVATNPASTRYAGGIANADRVAVKNCIVYTNTGVLSQNYGWTPLLFEYSLTTPDPGGVGIVTNDPQLNSSGNFHLWSNSPCIDVGTNLAWNLAPGAADLDGFQRIFNGTVDMGAFEFGGGALDCDFTMDDSVGFAPHVVVFSARVAGSNLSGLVYQWAFTNSGAIDAQGADKQVVTNTYAAGAYTATLTVTNSTGEIATFSNAVQVGPATTYVAQAGSPAFPYDSWATAATNFQPAIDAGVTGTVVLVSNGTYTVTTTTVVNAGVTLRSVNGYALTTVRGSGADFMTFNVQANAVLDGFTITKGKSLIGNARAIHLGNNATLQNCHVHHNTNLYGILMNVALVRNCLIVSNNGVYTGGIYLQDTGSVENCTIYGNVATNPGALYAGGISFRISGKGIAHNCIVYGNTNTGAGATTHNYGGFGAATIFEYSLTTPDPGEVGIVTNDPKFVNAAGTNFHLQAASPAVNTGTNLPWTLDANARDLDGKPRRIRNRVDMGAFEWRPPPGTVFTVF